MAVDGCLALRHEISNDSRTSRRPAPRPAASVAPLPVGDRGYFWGYASTLGYRGPGGIDSRVHCVTFGRRAGCTASHRFTVLRRRPPSRERWEALQEATAPCFAGSGSHPPLQNSARQVDLLGVTRTLLVVDDDTNLRQLVRRVVRKDFDADLLEAEHGLAALDLLQDTRVDLVMLDISMPIMNGIETLDAIRRIPQLAEVPVMILAGRAEERQVQQLISLGITGFLVKPFRPSLLRDRLGALLARVASPPALPPRPRIGGLALHADSRVLLVDDSPGFCALFKEHLGVLCRVEIAHGPVDALARCTSETLDGVFVGSLGPGIQTELFARKARLATGGAPIVALASVGQRATAEATGLFEFTVLRSYRPHALRGALRAMMTPQTIARWTLAPGNAACMVFGAAVRAIFADLLKRDVTVGHDRSIQGRRVCAAIEVQAHGLSWQLSLVLPYASALTVAQAELTQPVDQVSEVLVAHAVGSVVVRLGQALADTTASELALESTPPEIEITERSASDGEDGTGIQTWTLSWSPFDHASVTLTPLTPRSVH